MSTCCSGFDVAESAESRDLWKNDVNIVARYDASTLIADPSGATRAGQPAQKLFSNGKDEHDVLEVVFK